MTIEEFVQDPEPNDEVGELLDRYAKVDEICTRYSHHQHLAADVSNSAMELLGEIGKEIVRYTITEWEKRRTAGEEVRHA